MNHMRLLNVFAFASILVLICMFAVACGSEEATEAPIAEPTEAPEATEPAAAEEATEAPAPASDGEVFELKYSSPLSPAAVSDQRSAEVVGRRSGGAKQRPHRLD